jgi:hypothetical protein
MTQANVTGIISIACTQAIGQHLRVKNDVTYGLALAGATDEELGTVSGSSSSRVSAPLPPAP